MLRLNDARRAAILGVIGVLALLTAGSALIDAAFDWRTRQTYDDPRYLDFRGTCYWAGDVRNYMRIALGGYSNYEPSLLPPHMTLLNDRSWWPLFPNAAALVIRLGGGMCSSRTVNGIAYLLLIPVFRAITGERRGWRLWIVGVLPFGAWLYVGEADSFFLALSALLLWAVGQPDSPSPPRSSVAPPFHDVVGRGCRTQCGRGGANPDASHRLRGLLALGAGVLVGLAKPNALALIPALALWGLARTRDHVRAAAGGSRWRRALGDTNPGWPPVLGALGIVLATAWWIFQTSGFYPFYVLLIQRTLWWREFDPGSVAAFVRTFYTAFDYTQHGLFNMNELQRLIELAAVVFCLALSAAHLPPRWPGGESIRIPWGWRIGIWAMLLMMFTSGQSHAIERYAASNVFVVLAWHRVIFGAPGQRVIWRPWTLPGAVRWLWLAAGPVLWGLSFCLLGWNPLA